MLMATIRKSMANPPYCWQCLMMTMGQWPMVPDDDGGDYFDRQHLQLDHFDSPMKRDVSNEVSNDPIEKIAFDNRQMGKHMDGNQYVFCNACSTHLIDKIAKYNPAIYKHTAFLPYVFANELEVDFKQYLTKVKINKIMKIYLCFRKDRLQSP